jgi:hypothetical protein
MAIHHPPKAPARPVVRDHRQVSRPVVRTPVSRDRRDRDDRREHREPVRYRTPIVVQRPVIRANVWTTSPGYTYVPQPIQLMASTALGSEPISIGVNLGGATTLTLSSTGTGSTYVSQILLVEPDGDTRAVPVNAIVSPQNPTVQLPINGAGISQIVVEGHSDWGGSLALSAV